MKDAKSHDIPVVLKDFLAGVKTEGVVSMVRQHTISEWGQEPDQKIQKARAAAEGGGSLKSSGRCDLVIAVIMNKGQSWRIYCR